MAEINPTSALRLETGQIRLLEMETKAGPAGQTQAVAVGGSGAVSAEQSWEDLLKALNIHGFDYNVCLRFSVDEATGRTVIQIINADTQKVVQEIPPEEALRAAEHLQKMIPQIVDTKV